MMRHVATSATSETLHVSAVAIDGLAVLIEGPSGAGKSDLTLRLIDRGGMLVSDDYTILEQQGGALVARPPATIAGRIEVRGLGILSMAHAAQARVALLVRLQDEVERMPPAPATRRIAGILVREIALDARAPSAPIKVELALRQVVA